jgi:aminoglycoside 6'-N-acetyltransferase
MISLRQATSADVATLEAWDRNPHVIASGGVDPDEPANWAREITFDPAWWEVLIAEHDGRPIGVVQIIDPAVEETHYWGDCPPNLRAIDIWIGEAADLGRGYGTEMMRLALARCFTDPAVTAVLIDPLARNVRARKFYQRIGFVEVGQRRFGDDDCVVYRFDRR